VLLHRYYASPWSCRGRASSCCDAVGGHAMSVTAVSAALRLADAAKRLLRGFASAAAPPPRPRQTEQSGALSHFASRAAADGRPRRFRSQGIDASNARRPFVDVSLSLAAICATPLTTNYASPGACIRSNQPGWMLMHTCQLPSALKINHSPRPPDQCLLPGMRPHALRKHAIPRTRKARCGLALAAEPSQPRPQSTVQTLCPRL